MELIGSLFLILALAVIVGLFIARPFISGFKTSGDAVEARDRLFSALMAERDRVLTALQELDFDNALGKVPAKDYPFQRAALLKTGADTLRRLDEFNATGSTSSSTGLNSAEGLSTSESLSSAEGLSSAEDRIEAAVAARRADAHQASRRQPLSTAQPVGVALGANGKTTRADDLENIIASRKRERSESAGGFCPHCGKPVSKSDKFCSRCGATL